MHDVEGFANTRELELNYTATLIYRPSSFQHGTKTIDVVKPPREWKPTWDCVWLLLVALVFPSEANVPARPSATVQLRHSVRQ